MDVNFFTVFSTKMLTILHFSGIINIKLYILLFFKERNFMSVTYKKLRIMLAERNMKKKDFQEQAGLTHHEMLKLRNDMSITTDTIGKICKAMNCVATDIMDFFEDDEEQK